MIWIVPEALPKSIFDLDKLVGFTLNLKQKGGRRWADLRDGLSERELFIGEFGGSLNELRSTENDQPTIGQSYFEGSAFIL